MYSGNPFSSAGTIMFCQRCSQPLVPNEVQCRYCGYYNQLPQQQNAARVFPNTSQDNDVQQVPFPSEQPWGQSSTHPLSNNFAEHQSHSRQFFGPPQLEFRTSTSFQGPFQQPFMPAPPFQPAPQEQLYNINVFPSPAVLFEDVTCQVGKRIILDHVNLSIKQSDITGILGPNGAGKTTLLSSIMGLRHASSGGITVLGQKLPSRSAHLRKRIGVVLQETALYDELTTLENLRFAASLYDIPDPMQRINEVLELLALTNRRHERVRNLSGGLQRRVTIARALLHSPDLLIIDEPTLGVDVEARHAIWSHLRLLKASGKTIIVSTNYLDEALALCDAVAVLRTGKVLITDTPEALVARAGSCLDVECNASAGQAIMRALSRVEGILRVDQTATGLSIFLRGNTVSDSVVRIALQTANINGFRTRAADLAEVFHALEGISA